ncbi:hypothetical protein Krac_9188 [Ktedonobacter racemifer DSM 44963]|uniref:Uncharacterized protein n=1 Tax=Ktedonobacter racemifer DSM 44963 TaxID=485913 RepID=D6TRD8_KTERA|nr:hypothetical protein Krac_9188 [Ktedonobacter racemifer DSM 44963]
MIFPGLFRGPGYCITVVLAGGQAWYSGEDYRKSLRCMEKAPHGFHFRRPGEQL